MIVANVVKIISLFALLFSGIYLLWQNLPTEARQFESYHAQITQQLPLSSAQFYVNMRYTDKNIAYSLSPNCSAKKKLDFERAIRILEAKTILNFFQANEPEIKIMCSNKAQEPAEKGYFVAGEGGPTLIINSTRYAILVAGEIALYRPESCDQPQVALHELLHALGFDHNSNPQSIMYPVTNCEQTIDDEIIVAINYLYSQEPLPDAIIERVKANKSGPYLNFDITITNEGLAPIARATLDLFAENEKVKGFEIEAIDIGAKRTLTVTNLKIPRKTERIVFIVQTPQTEITTENNRAQIEIINPS